MILVETVLVEIMPVGILLLGITLVGITLVETTPKGRHGGIVIKLVEKLDDNTVLMQHRKIIIVHHCPGAGKVVFARPCVCALGWFAAPFNG